MSDAASQFTPAHLLHGVTSHPAPAPMQHLPIARPLRLWPGVLIVVLQWAVIKVPGLVDADPFMQFMCMFWGPVAGAVALAGWWLFASRLRWADRVLALLVCALAGIGATLLSHPSFKYGMLMYGLPMVTTAWVGWLLLTPFLNWPIRRAGLLATLLLGWGACDLVRMDGIDGNFSAELNWRWALTEEQKFRAERAARLLSSDPPAKASGKVLELKPGDWPGFRGPNRDGRLTGVRIATDWKENPPRELWKQRVGPGWSSFAAIGDRLYTQEQQEDDEEAVVCYRASTGEELWSHQVATRFTEDVSGAGPRATPTFHEGKIYAFGANGHLSCLDAITGRVHWESDVAKGSGAKVPQWGFSSSPLVHRGIVSVFAGGPEGKSVLGYHAKSGKVAWSAGEGELSYCSTQLARLGGVEQLLIATEAGLSSFHPTKGDVLWHHSWPAAKIARVVQPAVLSETDVLIGTGFSVGTRRLRVTHKDKKWAEEEVWTTRAIKPYYNDFVVYKDHLYGFDGPFFTCVRLEDGVGLWRARGYDNGQVLLLADQGLLLVMSEWGKVSLLEASPEKHTVLGGFQAYQKGKTWNHPVIAHGKLFVRNGEWMACYQLAEPGNEKAGK